MAIFVCNKCNHIQEVSNEYISKRAKCPHCGQEDMIYNTVDYIKELVSKYKAGIEEQYDSMQESQNKTHSNQDFLEVYDYVPSHSLNIHDTDRFSQEENYYPIVKWFNKKSIKVDVDPKMMDTTGFFDEVAIEIGDHFDVLGPVVGQIKYIQSKSYDTVKIVLSKYNDENIKQITDFCKMLHDYSFVARYTHVKKDKVIYLTLQEAPRVKNFFNGLWMEWFVLIKLIALFKKHRSIPAIARGIKITFPNQDSNELDIFYLSKQGEPVCIECKTGEFRQDLSKYLSLQKKLNIKKDNFILCVFGLGNEQVKGLTSMYDFTLANENTLIDHVQNLL